MASSAYNRRATIAKAEELVRTKMAHYDPSHDALHVWRVRRLALKIAALETEQRGSQVDADVVELAALFHDLQDHKYTPSSSGTGTRTGTSDEEMREIMHAGGLDAARAETVLRIVRNTSYSTEQKLRAAGAWTAWHQDCVELHCVQDADRLDAMGAFGICRAAAYSTAVNRPLYACQDEAINSARCQTDLPHVKGPQDKASSYQHFFDKLLLLKDTTKTCAGKAVGAKRHEIMVKAVEAMDEEFALADFP